MLAIVMTAFGSALAAAGFMFIGIAGAIAGGHETMTNAGWVLLIGGIVMAVIGAFWYRSTEAKLEMQRARIRQ